MVVAHSAKGHVHVFRPAVVWLFTLEPRFKDVFAQRSWWRLLISLYVLDVLRGTATILAIRSQPKSGWASIAARMRLPNEVKCRAPVIALSYCSCTISIACSGNGISCARRFFMRAAGMCQIRFLKSISSNRAPDVSFGRVVVRIIKCWARAKVPSRLRPGCLSQFRSTVISLGSSA